MASSASRGIGVTFKAYAETLAPRHTHVAGHGGFVVAAVDDEVVALGLAADGFINGCTQKIIAFRGAERRAQVGGILLAQAHV